MVAPFDSSVLLSGETGTGKELIARAIHDLGPRRDQRFVAVNCAAIPSGLLESELFGHERGAFTGAVARSVGRFQCADRGTLFLDEIGDLPLELQPKLLRALQEQQIERLGGGGQALPINVRVIAATNQDLFPMVERRQFRADLYYRLNVFPIVVPPLRERAEDIRLLVASFVQRFSERCGKTIEHVPDSVIAALRGHSWPGNIRELQNVIERAVITARDGQLNLDRAIPEGDTAPRAEGEAVLTEAEMRELERRNILRALEAAGWKVAGSDGAARRLGTNPSTLNSRMKALGVRRPTP
jgi:formate hydrogenlyase transcriptional activator